MDSIESMNFLYEITERTLNNQITLIESERENMTEYTTQLITYYIFNMSTKKYYNCLKKVWLHIYKKSH
jgi:hypothetical protein